MVRVIKKKNPLISEISESEISESEIALFQYREIERFRKVQ